MTGLLVPVRSDLERSRSGGANWRALGGARAVGRAGQNGQEGPFEGSADPQRVIYVNCRPRRSRFDSLMDAAIQRYLAHESLRPEQARGHQLSILV